MIKLKKVYSRYKTINIAAKASLWFMFCSLLQKGISTITVPIFTRMLTTDEYGVYSLFLSWFNIFTIITSLNLYYGGFYNALNKYKKSEERDRYIASMQGLTMTLTIVLAIIYLPFQHFWSNTIGLSQFVLWLMIIELLVEPSLIFWSVRQRFEYKYKTMVVVTLLKSALNPILGLFLVMMSRGDRATARIISVVVVEIIIAGIFMLWQFYKGKMFYYKSFWKSALAFNLPLLPHYLSGTILSQADRIMIERMCGKSQVGIYSVAYNVGMFVMLVTNAISDSMNPWIYDKLNRKDFQTIRKRINEILFCIVVVIILLLFFVPELISIFAPPEYSEAIYVVPPVAASIFFIFLYTLFASPQLYFEEQKFMPIASILAAIINIILNAIFIKIYGYIAAGYTTLASYVFYSLGHYWFSRRVCKKKIGEKIFDGKSILMMGIAIIIGTIIFSLLYRLTVIRYIFGGIIAGTIFINRRRIIVLFKGIRNHS